MPLAPLIAPDHLASLLQSVEVPDALRQAALEWNDKLSGYQSGTIKEQQNRGQFLQLIFREGLGFKPDGTVPQELPFTMREEQKTEVRQDFPDASFGRFGGLEREDATYAVFELKDSDKDLDQRPAGAYSKSPVEQGFSYADKHQHAEFILVSNFREIRLYARQARQLRAWTFHFQRLAHADRETVLKELAFFLSPSQLIPEESGGQPRLLGHIQAAPLQQERITREFFAEFKTLRDEARNYYERLLLDQNDQDSASKALQASQKLLNRTLFAGFAQSRHLLPEHLLADLRDHTGRLEEKPIHRNLKKLFQHMDKGFLRHFTGSTVKLEIPGFNGGLFRIDKIVDSSGMALTEELSLKLLHLADRDFLTELPVSVLGHCFEASLRDLDAATGRAGDTRHDEGIYYTPDWVTRYICRQVLGPLVEIHRNSATEATKQKRGDRPEKLGKAQAEWDLAVFQTLWSGASELRILDPACGSGAFLAMGHRVLLDLLEPDRRQAIAQASTLPDSVENSAHEEFPGFQLAEETPRSKALAGIEAMPSLERCFFGVDLHAEAVMLAQLSLWLETARKGAKLSDLSDRIKQANSLTADWGQLFPGQSFDAIIGNPPYVRMELFKDQKAHLKMAFPKVHEERADLYCYFFQLSGELLKEGGRYGIIVSNKWLRAKYGTPSRAYLKAHFQIEELLDFGELPVFVDATTYPLILVAQKADKGTTHPVRYRGIKELPLDDGALVRETIAATNVPSIQLGEEAWMLMDETQGSTFSRRAAKGISLREYLGDTPICWGIKTGLNDAFWLSQAQRDEITAKNPEAKEILKPLVIGEEIRRWAIRQDEPRWLIYTPKGRYAEAEFRDRFPSVAAHLEPFRSYTKNGKTIGLDHRATKQTWFELQQAQGAYEQFFSSEKLLWPVIAMESRWTIDTAETPKFPNDKCFLIPTSNEGLLGTLNSNLVWSQIIRNASILQGGSRELREHTLARVMIPNSIPGEVGALARSATQNAALIESHRRPFLRFLRQDAPWRIATVGDRLSEFWRLKPEEALAEALKRRDKHAKEPTAGQREHFIQECREARERILEAQDRIAKLETELNIAVDAAWETP